MFTRIMKYLDPTMDSKIITEEFFSSKNFGLMSISVRVIDGKNLIVLKFMGHENEKDLIIDKDNSRLLKLFLEKNEYKID
jgi:hypothetical protein